MARAPPRNPQTMQIPVFSHATSVCSSGTAATRCPPLRAGHSQGEQRRRNARHGGKLDRQLGRQHFARLAERPGAHELPQGSALNAQTRGKRCTRTSRSTTVPHVSNGGRKIATPSLLIWSQACCRCAMPPPIHSPPPSSANATANPGACTPQYWQKGRPAPVAAHSKRLPAAGVEPASPPECFQNERQSWMEAPCPLDHAGNAWTSNHNRSIKGIACALSGRGESGWCPDGTSTPGAWRHAGVQFLLSGAKGHFDGTFRIDTYIAERGFDPRTFGL